MLPCIYHRQHLIKGADLYGEKFNKEIDGKYLVSIHHHGSLSNECRHKRFPDALIRKTHAKTQEKTHVLLFTSDLALDAETMIDYYSLRFQIEFNFRDAKQFWGLDDFINVLLHQRR